jgi:hypothetical protein
MKLLKIFILLILLTGCKTRTVYIPLETVKTEYQNVHTRDSVYLRDSVHIAQKGDTVLIEKYRVLYKNRFLHDSIFLQDSVPYPVEVRVPYPVEKPFTWWQRTQMIAGNILLIGLLAGGIVWVIRKKFFKS